MLPRVRLSSGLELNVLNESKALPLKADQKNQKWVVLLDVLRHKAICATNAELIEGTST